MITRPSTISAINRLRPEEQLAYYKLLIPAELLGRFGLSLELRDSTGRELFSVNCSNECTYSEMALYHQAEFPDPILYGMIADTVNGQIHILEYVINDPTSPRFDTDRLPNGQFTHYGILQRNLEAEVEALKLGLAPGQVRRGLRMLGSAIQAFETFAAQLGQEYYFAEPLAYHNAVLFERYGFGYQKGRLLMERLQNGFKPGGDLLAQLDGSNPFRNPSAANSIRLRSWAIHDNILGEPFTDVTMYKWVGKSAGINTSNDCPW